VIDPDFDPVVVAMVMAMLVFICHAREIFSVSVPQGDRAGRAMRPRHRPFTMFLPPTRPDLPSTMEKMNVLAGMKVGDGTPKESLLKHPRRGEGRLE
jgi:hypothetical protein